MSEQASPGAAGSPAETARPALTPEAVEAILNDFRAWLQQPGTDRAAPADEPAFQWQTLVEAFTALRHEVNLQTRAARAQMEQTAEALDALDGAGAAPSADDDEAVRPLLKTLVDVYDALGLALREVQRVQAVVDQLLEGPSPADVAPKGSWWRRWFGQRSGPDPQQVTAAADIRRFLNSLVTGYRMSLERIDRALAQHDLEVIHCVGERFDPELMEAAEVVTQGGRTGTEVLEEVRRGYRWRGRLFRCAQVRVARP